MSTVTDVNFIYKVVNAITNKEQKGYIKPSEFNTLLQHAELENFSENFYEAMQPNQSPRGFESDLERTDALIPYLRIVSGTADTIALPAGYMHVVSVSSGTKEVKAVRHSELYTILDSSIVAPSAANPIYVIAPTTTGETPATSVSLYNASSGPNSMAYKITYLAQPNIPINGHYTVNSVTGLFDASVSTALDAPKSEHTKLINRMLQYLGIHLKDADVISYASSQLINE